MRFTLDKVTSDNHNSFTVYAVSGPGCRARKGKTVTTYEGTYQNADKAIADCKTLCQPHTTYYVKCDGKNVAVVRGGYRVA